MNEKLSILKLLIENSDKEFSIREISLLRGINYKSAYQNIKKLEKEGVIDVRKKGNVTLCSFNRNFNDSVYLVEYERRATLLKNKNFRIIFERLRKINKQFILLLFGSHVKKTVTRHSDIDLLLVVDDPAQIDRELSLIPLNIHLSHFTYEEFISMLKSKEASVVSEALKHNIILFGIEDYYRLIENAK